MGVATDAVEGSFKETDVDAAAWPEDGAVCIAAEMVGEEELGQISCVDPGDYFQQMVEVVDHDLFAVGEHGNCVSKLIRFPSLSGAALLHPDPTFRG